MHLRNHLAREFDEEQLKAKQGPHHSGRKQWIDRNKCPLRANDATQHTSKQGSPRRSDQPIFQSRPRRSTRRVRPPPGFLAPTGSSLTRRPARNAWFGQLASCTWHPDHLRSMHRSEGRNYLRQAIALACEREQPSHARACTRAHTLSHTHTRNAATHKGATSGRQGGRDSGLTGGPRRIVLEAGEDVRDRRHTAQPECRSIQNQLYRAAP